MKEETTFSLIRAAAFLMFAFTGMVIVSCDEPISAAASPALMLASLAAGPSQLETESSSRALRFKQQLDVITQRCDGVDQFAMADAVYHLHEFTKKHGDAVSIEELLNNAVTLSGDFYAAYKDEGSCIDILKTTVATAMSDFL